MSMNRRPGVLVVGVMVLGLALGAGVGPGYGQGMFYGSALNPQCIGMRITYGTCGIIPYPCAHLSFWEPKWIVTTKSKTSRQGNTHRHFFDATVKPVNFLFTFNDPCGGCAVPTPGALVPFFYESTLDPGWRAAQGGVMSAVVSAMRVGLWGGYYPRVGFVTHTSPVAASGLAATRAFDIARQPVDLSPVAGLVRPTVPLVPTAQTVALPCMGLRIPPFPVPCFRAGLDVGALMLAPAMPTGLYEWVIWKRKRCSVPVPANWCAEALNNLPKLNLCF